MLKLTLFLVAAAALAGCASARERSAAVIQAELPQLVIACDGAFQDGRKLGLGIVTISDGIDACDRLAHARSLDLVRPVTVELYRRYLAAERTRTGSHISDREAADRAARSLGTSPAPGMRDPAEVAKTGMQDALATFPGAAPPAFTIPR
jgi:hypothetical protein